MTNEVSNKFQEQRKDFLRYLGAKNNNELKKNLEQSFHGDSFESNIKAVFENFHLQRGANCENFYSSFLSWGETKLDEAFKLRWKVASSNTVGLFAAFGLTFLNPIAGIVTGIAVSTTCGVAEGVAKRNVGNFGHLEGHLSHKIHACTKRMLDTLLNNNNLTEDAKKSLEELTSPKSQSQKSAVARVLSYLSGPVVSGINNLISKFGLVSNVVSGTLGTFIPFLPLVTVALSRAATNIRHNSAVSESDFLDKVTQIIFDENSWNNASEAEIKVGELTKQFANEIANSDSHGRIPGDKKFHQKETGSKDKNTNPKKAITFSSWVSAKVCKFVTRKILKKDVEDIAEVPKVHTSLGNSKKTKEKTGARVILNIHEDIDSSYKNIDRPSEERPSEGPTRLGGSVASRLSLDSPNQLLIR